MHQNQTLPTPEPSHQNLHIRIFGIGNAGLKVLQHLAGPEIPASALVAIDKSGPEVDQSPALEKIGLGKTPCKRLGTHGDPEHGRELAQEHIGRIQELCQGQDVVFLVSALGGGTGSGAAPVVAQAAKDAGALVLSFVFTPFDIETTRLKQFAAKCLSDLRNLTDGVVCLPNQQVFKFIDPQTKFSDTFHLANAHLADAIRGVWRLLLHKGLIEIHFTELAAVLRESHSDSAFAVCEASGPTRVDTVVKALLSHPVLGECSPESDTATALVSLIAGPELTMVEVNQVMSGISACYSGAQIVMGAAVSEQFKDRLSVTLFISRRKQPREKGPEPVIEHPHEGSEGPAPRLTTPVELPPAAPSIITDRLNFGGGPETQESRTRKSSGKMRQAQLPLNMPAKKGRFDQSEPTIHKGEDLDVPTYVRRGLMLN